LFTAKDARPKEKRQDHQTRFMNHTSYRSHILPASDSMPVDGAARSVHRAVGDIRSGVPVAIAADGARLLALPAETATAATLAEFLRWGGAQPTLLLALSRAVAGRIGAATLDSTTDTACLTLDATRLNVDALRSLADPTLLQAAEHLVLPSQPSLIGPPAAQAALSLAKLARLLPAMLVAQLQPGLVPDDLLSVSAAAIAAYPARAAAALVRVATARVPLDEAADARIVAFRPPDGGIEHLAILIGDPEHAESPLVRVHSECFTGDLLGSRRCDCGPQLHQAIRRMAAEGAGVLLYMAQEGRGIGLVNKLRAYTLQDAGLDTLDANRALGFDADERSFAAAATMLKQLGITRLRLLTNNPQKIAGLTAHGVTVTGRISHAIAANGENDSYLETKARRFGHLLG
jgi:GTP cyclohydrolase II